MTELPPTQHFIVPDGCAIAFRQCPSVRMAGTPTLVFLPGYMSEMAGGKATALMQWAQAYDTGCLLLDYSGCGESSGDFANGTLSRWCDEVLALISAQVTGKVVLAGSSMGGWLMLLVARELVARRGTDALAGMIGIAAAPDFTDWGFNDEQRERLARGETIYEDNPYGPEPTPTYARFWADGQRHRLLGEPIALDAPVRLLHGQRDTDVPWDVSIRLAAALSSDDVRIQLVKDGDHRLSREGDVALLLAAAAELTGSG